MIEWKNVLISDLGQTVTGKTPSLNFPEDFGDEFMFVTPSDDLNNKTINSSERYLSKTGIDKLWSKALPPRSILISCIGSAMGKVTMNGHICVTNQQINAIKLNQLLYDADYIYYLLKNNYKLLRNAASGSTAVPLLNKTDFENIALRLHTNLPTQQKIASVLSSIDSKIELNNRITAELEAMAKTIYDYWFVQFDFPEKNGKPYKSSGGKMIWNNELKREIPEGWEVKRLDEVATVKAGGDKPNNYSSEKTEINNVPIYSNGITNEGLYGYTNKSIIKEQSITISARGTIGYCVLRNKPFVPIIRLISLTPNFKGSAKYFYEALKNFIFENSGSVQQQLTVPQVISIKILYPNEGILEKFNNIIIPLINRTEIIEEENQKLTELRDWLLPMLMNGQVTLK